MAQDPICGMKTDEKISLRVSHEDKEYFFCSHHCAQKFVSAHNIPGDQIVNPDKKRNPF